MIDGHGRPMSVSAQGVVRLLDSEWGRTSADGTVTDAFGALRARLDGERVVDASGALGGAPVQITLDPPGSPSRRVALLVVLIALLRPSARDIETAPEVELTFDLRPQPPERLAG